MAKKQSAKAAKPKSRRREPGPFEVRNVDLTKFKPDISLGDWIEMFKPGNIDIGPAFFMPIEMLSPIKTIGKARTNLTFINPTIVQTDAALPYVPYARFDKQTEPAADHGMSVHFQASGYGFTTPGTYFMAFSIETFGRATFELSGYAGSGTTSGTGPKTLTGKNIVTIIFKNIPASQEAWGYLKQTGGGPWVWYNTRISLPPIVLGM
jgi:hypothetical protein